MPGSVPKPALGALCLLSALFLSALFGSPASADQQKGANGYVHWRMDGQPADLTELHQDVWVARQGHGFQWVMVWLFGSEGSRGGYFGFNVSEKGKAQALFSVWGGTEATTEAPSQCIDFAGEGTGKSCRAEYTLKSNRFYRLHLLRTVVEDGGAWWSASILEDGASPSQSLHLGAIKAEAGDETIRPTSLTNFIEYFGPAVDCTKIPRSGVYFSPPLATSSASSGSKPNTSHFTRFTSGTGCPHAQVGQGAHFLGGTVSVRSAGQSEFGAGAFLYLGGQGGTVNDLILEEVPPPGSIVLLTGR